MKKLISIVTPTFNEKDNIKPLCLAISNQMAKLNYEYEHIVIDNCSNDGTIETLRELTKTFKNLKVIVNSRNFGHIRSPVHGMFQATGEAVILMMSDFQDPIDLIPKYITEWENGNKVVMAQKNTSDENFILHYFKKIFYKFANKVSDTPLLINTTGSGLFDKEILNILKKIDDPYPYFRGLIPEITQEIKLIKFHQPKRQGGKTKNNFYTLYDLGILGIIKHSKIPLRLMTLVGFFASFISIILGLVYLLAKILYWSSFNLGIAPMIIGFFFFASFQIFLLGFIGEYVMTILTHSRKLPLVIEKERMNF
jgi:polyisoprenyl-phosphate glycosyltransferase